MQGPLELLRRLSRVMRQMLGNRRHLLIIDDVRPEDIPLFEGGWLALDTLQGGSICVLTSRDCRCAASASGNYEVVPLHPADDALAQRILLLHACPKAHVAEAQVAPDIQVQFRTPRWQKLSGPEIFDARSCSTCISQLSRP
jgi:hypothetical protein